MPRTSLASFTPPITWTRRPLASMAGRGWIGIAVPNPSDLRQSRNLYAEGFEKAPDDYYTGINAASKSLLLGEPDKAAAYAEKVQDIVGDKAVRGDYWQTATIAEVQLLQRKYAEAGDMYQQAIDIAPNQIASQDSTYRQARLLLTKLGATREEQLVVLRPFKDLPNYVNP